MQLKTALYSPPDKGFKSLVRLDIYLASISKRKIQDYENAAIYVTVKTKFEGQSSHTCQWRLTVAFFPQI